MQTGVATQKKAGRRRKTGNGDGDIDGGKDDDDGMVLKRYR